MPDRVRLFVLRLLSAISLPALGLLAAACADGPELVAEAGAESELQREVGFVELEPLSFELGGTSYESDRARLFYRFAPAPQASEKTPLCVLFNGGPGIGSGIIDEQLGTRLPGGADNPNSFAALCHVLSVDARNAGFSYLLSGQDFGPDNYNVYLDAADFLRTLLRLVDERPELNDAPVVLVGESFGGARATVMLDLLYNAEQYAAGQRPFYSEALLGELDQHARTRGLESIQQLSAYFRHQVLIQPSLTSDLQHRIMAELMAEPGSIVQQLAAEQDRQFEPCPQDSDCDPYSHVISFVTGLDRSPYDYRAPSSWLADLLSERRQHVADIDGLEARWGTAVDQVPGLLPADRESAWRVADSSSSPDDVATWLERFGELGINDRYFVSLHAQVTQAFDAPAVREAGGWWRSDEVGRMFLTNLSRVNTFITRASFDLVGYSPALALAWESYPEVSRVELVEEPLEAERPGQWVLYDASGQVLGTIRAPNYDASHSVALAHAGELLEDVQSWWREVEQ